MHKSRSAQAQERQWLGETNVAGFENLHVQILNCQICAPNLPLGARPVLQVHPDARILVASQAPGRKVHETGIPFNDPSGDRLREWMGIERKEFYDQERVAIVPMGFCFPGTGKTGDLAPRHECAPAWRKPLLNQLHNIELTLAVGQYAVAYHLGGGSAGHLPISCGRGVNIGPGCSQCRIRVRATKFGCSGTPGFTRRFCLPYVGKSTKFYAHDGSRNSFQLPLDPKLNLPYKDRFSLVDHWLGWPGHALYLLARCCN